MIILDQTRHDNTIQSNTTPHKATQYNTMQDNTLQTDTRHYKTTQYNTSQGKTRHDNPI